MHNFRYFVRDTIWSVHIRTARTNRNKKMNWKTTLLGVFTILAAVADAGKEFLANGSLGDVGLLFAAVTAGVGLILAKDSK
jgi:hypothetical protein